MQGKEVLKQGSRNHLRTILCSPVRTDDDSLTIPACQPPHYSNHVSPFLAVKVICMHARYHNANAENAPSLSLWPEQHRGIYITG